MRALLVATAVATTACSGVSESSSPQPHGPEPVEAAPNVAGKGKGKGGKAKKHPSSKPTVKGNSGLNRRPEKSGKISPINPKHGTKTPSVRPVRAPSAQESKAGMLAHCSDGQVVFGFWQGEYPSPIPQIEKTVVVDVHDTPCGGPVRGCALGAGLLHPWANVAQKSSQQTFATRTRTVSYTLRKAHSVGGVQLTAGSKVTVLSYLSEGYCSMLADDQLVEASCPGPDSKLWRADGDTDPVAVQLVEIGCSDGPSGWLVVDEAFMNRRDVQSGQIRGYGEVGRAR